MQRYDFIAIYTIPQAVNIMETRYKLPADRKQTFHQQIVHILNILPLH